MAGDGDETSGPASADGDTAGAGAPGSGSQYRAAIDRYREAAKWAVGAFGGIGALLVATLPLAQFGAGAKEAPEAVYSGALLSIGGVAVAIAATLAVLAPRSVFTFDLEAKRRPVARFFSGRASMQHLLFEHGPELLPAGIADLRGLTTAIRNIDQLVAAAGGSPQNEKGIPNLRRQQAAHAEQLERLLWIARVQKMRASFHWSSAAIVLGGLSVGLGVGLLFVGLHDSSAAQKATAETDKIVAETGKVRADAGKVRAEAAKVRSETAASAEPAAQAQSAVPAPRAQVSLTEEGRSLLPSCTIGADDRLPVLVLSGDSASGTWNVMILPSPGCAGGRLSLTAELGTLS